MCTGYSRIILIIVTKEFELLLSRGSPLVPWPKGVCPPFFRLAPAEAGIVVQLQWQCLTIRSVACRTATLSAEGISFLLTLQPASPCKQAEEEVIKGGGLHCTRDCWFMLCYHYVTTYAWTKPWVLLLGGDVSVLSHTWLYTSLCE